jgi:hypothetical protein
VLATCIELAIMSAVVSCRSGDVSVRYRSRGKGRNRPTVRRRDREMSQGFPESRCDMKPDKLFHDRRRT